MDLDDLLIWISRESVELSDHSVVFGGETPGFESMARCEDRTTWSARGVAVAFGYSSYESFRTGPLAKAQQVLLSLGIDTADHFKAETDTDADGKPQKDCRLSRFACYLAAMNGDPKKPAVAKAQAYFATFAEYCRRYIEEHAEIERILIRDDVSDHERSLSSTAKSAGATNYAFFQNAGYMGLYNMSLNQLKSRKGVPSGRTPLDFMGREELAANLFRLTQTEAKIKNQSIEGQKNLEKAAKSVGATVRQTMERLSGDKPEDLPPAEDIKKIKTALKQTEKGLQSVDNGTRRGQPS